MSLQASNISSDAMLSDRSYMRDDYPRESTSALTWILCALVAGFVVQNVFGRWLGSSSFETLFGLTLGSLRQGYVWSLLTYPLLHTNLLHLLFNGLGLFFLGREMLPMLGTRRFLGLLATAAVVGALFWLVVHTLNGNPGQLLGASGCVMALFILFACVYADREITFLLFFVIPLRIKPKYLAWVLIGIDLLGFLFSEIPGRAFDTGVAYSAHLGGILVGWLYYRFVHASQGLDRASGLSLPSWLRRRAKAPATTRPSAPAVPGKTSPALRAEVDRILDKINSQGFGALTDQEKRVLDEAKDMLNRH